MKMQSVRNSAGGSRGVASVSCGQPGTQTLLRQMVPQLQDASDPQNSEASQPLISLCKALRAHALIPQFLADLCIIGLTSQFLGSLLRGVVLVGVGVCLSLDRLSCRLFPLVISPSYLGWALSGDNEAW